MVYQRNLPTNFLSIILKEYNENQLTASSKINSYTIQQGMLINTFISITFFFSDVKENDYHLSKNNRQCLFNNKSRKDCN